MEKDSLISRRAFLKLAVANVAALALLNRQVTIARSAWGLIELPRQELNNFSARVADILSKVPNTEINKEGYLVLLTPDRQPSGYMPLAQTQWNKENCSPFHRLYQNISWGIVLHWYGDKENFDRSINGYLRGFDSLRKVDDYITRTSAHFLVGPQAPRAGLDLAKDEIGIIQTQIPDKDGTPFVASHLRPINFKAVKENKQYFLRALYQLSYSNPKIHSVLQDLYNNPRADPNNRTIAIEVTGYNFENQMPGDQQIANVLSVVWAVMKRYGISAANILGHNEIQLGKPDPGKKFTALIRYLVGVKALVENDEKMFQLVFGQFIGADLDAREAVRKYLKFTRDYLLLVCNQRGVYEWESISNYWLTYDLFSDDSSTAQVANQFNWPINGKGQFTGYTYLAPPNHEGIDVSPEKTALTPPFFSEPAINLVANGKCLFVGEGGGHCRGKVAIFRHRQTDGAEIISIYRHLTQYGEIKVGKQYPKGYPIGSITGGKTHDDSFLHFALAYAATWDSDPKNSTTPPLNATGVWIRERFMHPYDYLYQKI
jgi:hypothetical protein